VKLQFVSQTGLYYHLWPTRWKITGDEVK